MAITCSGCGRQYDVTLFSFGRTIHCTCGRRVSRDEQWIELESDAPRFLVDAMLGSLARWLRIAGFDAGYMADTSDEKVVRRALEERRLILTRDRKLPKEWTAPAVMLVEAEEGLEQLAEVLQRLDLLDEVEPFSRCSLCNEPLEEASEEAVAEQVPERVRRAESEFRCCPDCGRVYWRGSHTERMEAELERVRSVADGS